jgi:hypothetical protein
VAAGAVVEQLAQEYERAHLPVLFLEHNVDQPPGNRIDRWWDAVDPRRSCEVPLVMIDSGWRHTCGPESFRAVYTNLVNQALQHQAGADITASFTRTGNHLDVWLRVTNWSGVALGPAKDATVNVLVVERTKVVHTTRFVRAAADVAVPLALAPGLTGSYRVQLDNVPVGEWSRAFVLALVDYRPDATSTRHEALQSAIAVEAPPSSPTPPPTVTPPPTLTPPATATPAATTTSVATDTVTPGSTAAATPVPSATATPPGPTAPPPRPKAYLPWLQQG